MTNGGNGTYFKGKIPATGYRITPTGRDAFAHYWEHIAAIGQSVAQTSHTHV